MAVIKGFRDLIVYQKAFDVAYQIFVFSKEFPKDEKYSLTDQIRRSSRSIAANIAEAWAKKIYPKAFISKLSDSLAEEFETEVWLDFCFNTHPDRWTRFDEIIEECMQKKGVLVVNYHQNVFHEPDYPGYTDEYIQIIEKCVEKKATFKTMGEYCDEMFNNSR